MNHIRTGVRIARKIQDSEHAIDHAIIAVSAMIQTMVEGRLEAGVAAQTGHEALNHAVEGLARLNQVRGDVIAGHDVLKAVADAAGGLRKTQEQAIRAIGVTGNTYYRWRKEYGGLKLDQAKRLKDLEAENARLKRAVAELTVDNQILKGVIRNKL